MRYHLDSELPIDAFSPRGGRSPFSRGMTLEGGGGGLLGGVTHAIGSIVGGATKAVQGIVQPIYNATLKNIPGVDSALVNLDKSVGKAIPGGWGTVAAVASSFVPGAQLAAMGMTPTGLATGLGALSGSGVMHKGNNFNLQGAIMGGALAYGSAELGKAFTNAATPTDKLVESNILNSGSGSALTGTGSAGADTGLNIAANGPGASMNTVGGGAGTGIGMNTTPAPVGINAPASSVPGLDITTPGSSYAQAGPSMLDKISNLPSTIADKASSAYDTLTSPDTYSNLGTKIADTTSGTLDNMGKAASGVGNVISGASSLPAGTLTSTAVPMIIGGAGLKALEEQQKYLDEQAKNGAISNAEYNSAKAKIDEQVAAANKAVAANPLHISEDTSNIKNGPTLYSKSNKTLYDKPFGSTTLYAAGGQVQTNSMSNPPDDQTQQPNQTPISQIGNANPYNGFQSLFAGLQGFNTNQQQNQQTQKPFQMFSDPQPPSQSFSGGFPKQLDSGNSGGFGGIGGGNNALPLEGQYGIVKMAAGGMAPRFLSGGGDGMSDSIPANINGSQEARLADGEFVIPADVVSHLGNGSSKAGAKQLYSMMDKVRQARTGRKLQGKQINPRKYLAA